MHSVAESALWEALGRVTDPELPVSIVDLGMVYELEIADDGIVTVDLTFTSLGCPAMDMLLEDVRREIEGVPGVTSLTINVVWSPPWTKARLTARGRGLLMTYGLSV